MNPRRWSFLILLLVPSLLIGCSDDPVAPDPGGGGEGVLATGAADFVVRIDATSPQLGGSIQGPFLLLVSNLRYEAGTLAADMVLLNAGADVAPEPVGLVFRTLLPEGAAVLGADNGVTGPGALFWFEFANDDGMWTPGESSFPRTLRFAVDPGVAVGFAVDILAGGGQLLQGSISGTVWNDLDRDGVRDPGEPGMGMVTLLLEGDLPIMAPLPFHLEAVTDSTGAYAFTNLPSGAYVLGPEPLPGRAFTTPALLHVLLGGDDGGVSNFEGADFGLAPLVGPNITVIAAEADAMVRTDLDARRNDNHGADPFLGVGGSRGGGGIPYGGADGIRSFIRFPMYDCVAVPGMGLAKATLELTIAAFRDGLHQSYEISVSPVMAPWGAPAWPEGNGSEVLPHPPGVVWVDEADGIAWVGAGDGGDANNVTQPDFWPQVDGKVEFEQDQMAPGDVVRIDVTALVEGWWSGMPNHGLVLRDITSDGQTFKQVWFGSRDGVERDHTDSRVQPGPRLVLEFEAPQP